MSITTPRTKMRKKIASLLRRCRSPYVGERAEAEREFRELGTDGVNALFELIDLKTRLWLKRRKTYFTLVAMFVCVAIPLMAYQMYLGVQSGLAGDGVDLGRRFGLAFGGILGPFGGGILGGFAWLLAPPVELTLAANLLAELDDARSVRPLIKVLCTRMMDANVRFAAATALGRLLPLSETGSAIALDVEDRRLLAKYLLRSVPDKEEALIRAILTALSSTGDTETLRALKAFHGRSARGVHEAAEEAVSRLEARLNRAAETGNLLRAASPAEPESSLLRPASSDRTEDPALLLRATQSNEH